MGFGDGYDMTCRLLIVSTWSEVRKTVKETIGVVLERIKLHKVGLLLWDVLLSRYRS